jgi:hypothetical protein
MVDSSGDSGTDLSYRRLGRSARYSPTDDELREPAGKVVDFARAMLEAKADPGS